LRVGSIEDVVREKEESGGERKGEVALVEGRRKRGQGEGARTRKLQSWQEWRACRPKDQFGEGR